jgi:membrane protein YqaA with SNARE-associated domain
MHRSRRPAGVRGPADWCLMSHIVAWVQSLTMALGGPGLFFVAFLDSSVLSLPEVVDLLVMLMVFHHRDWLIYYGLLATAGSIAGCLVVYWLGRKGGEAFLRKRFHERHLERGMALFQRYGLLAVLVPSILPPPTPFKLFVVSAGIARVSIGTFVLAVAVGRGLRFFALGLLAVRYGDQAVEYFQQHGQSLALVAAAVVLIGGIGYFLWRAWLDRGSQPA